MFNESPNENNDLNENLSKFSSLCYRVEDLLNNPNVSKLIKDSLEIETDWGYKKISLKQPNGYWISLEQISDERFQYEDLENNYSHQPMINFSSTRKFLDTMQEVFRKIQERAYGGASYIPPVNPEEPKDELYSVEGNLDDAYVV